MTDRVKTCLHSDEEIPSSFACQWSVGRKDIPPHIADGGYWLEKGSCKDCPCWELKTSVNRTDLETGK